MIHMKCQALVSLKSLEKINKKIIEYLNLSSAIVVMVKVIKEKRRTAIG